MDQDFRPHPVLTNYEVSRDGVVRNRRLKKSVGWENNQGYLMFGVGGKKYHIHRAVYETYNGPIRDGLIIDHIDSCPQNNKLSNLQAITLKGGKQGKSQSLQSLLGHLI